MTTDTVGGVWTYAMELCRGLGACGVDVMLATMGPPVRPNQRAEVSSLANVTLRESTFSLEWMDDPWADVERAGDWLLECEAEFAPDVIHLNGYSHAALTWQAPAMVVAHSCVLSWWNAVRNADAPATWRRYEEAVRAGLNAADLVIAPTRWMSEAINFHYGPLRDVRVISNGRDPSQFAPAEKKPFVLSVGRVWDEAKNVRALASIAPDLPWPVCVAGDSRSPTGEGGEFENVDLLGYLGAEETARWYARAAIYALPARYEPFGLSVLEAALSGCALVLSDIPSLRELWDGVASFASADDAAEFRTAILKLIENPARRAALAKRARLRAAEFTEQRQTRAYLGAYRELLNARRVLVSSL
jgi:glycogen synthase